MLKPSSSCFQFLLPKARTQLAEETALIKNVMKFCWYKSLVLQWFIRKFLAKFTLQINLARFFDCFKFDLIFPLHSNLELIFPKCSNHAIEYVYKCSGCSTYVAQPARQSCFWAFNHREWYWYLSNLTLHHLIFLRRDCSSLGAIMLRTLRCFVEKSSWA